MISLQVAIESYVGNITSMSCSVYHYMNIVYVLVTAHLMYTLLALQLPVAMII